MNDWYRDGPKYTSFRAYWSAYGGIKSLSKSPYLGIALLLFPLFFPLWSSTGSEGEFKWVPTALGILPSLMGFSLGAVAVIISFGDRAFDGFLHKERDGKSYFLTLIATFFHFIVLQVLSIVLCLLVLTYQSIWVSGIAFLFFIYSILAGLAAGAALFGAARIIDLSRRPPNDR